MPTVVIGTAGHIDHGKTALLRALTGIDADRLPEERERGMTIDVGYAHLDLSDGTSLDFVDVPGHDKLVGNMLVGAGEIDAALLVVAADDGPRAQTLEHVQLLDRLQVRDGVAVVTKLDLVDSDRAAAVAVQVERLLAGTSLAGVPVLAVSATTRAGIEDLLAELIRLRDRVAVRRLSRAAGPLRLPIDRVFAIRGRGVVVTGTLWGGPLAVGDRLRVEPGGGIVRVRELQVHNTRREGADGGRTAVNLVGAEAGELRRGQVLTDGAGVEASDRILVALRSPAAPKNGSVLRLHLGTAQVEAAVSRRARESTALPDGSVSAILRLDAPVATFVGDRGVLRRPSPAEVVAGVRVLDPVPPRGVSRRRLTPERLGDLAIAVDAGDQDGAADALVGIHGALATGRVQSIAMALRPPDPADGSTGSPPPSGHATSSGLILASEVVSALEAEAAARVTDHEALEPRSAGLSLGELRSGLLQAVRRLVTIDHSSLVAATAEIDRIVEDLVARRRLIRDGDRVRDGSREPGLPASLLAAMDRLVAALSVPAPPPLGEAAREAGCSADGIRGLIAAGRITRLDADLAWATPMYHRLAATALGLARGAAVTPAALRDATGTSRRYVLAILEDLDRREILQRTPEGHVPGPRAPSASARNPDAIP